MSEEESAFDRRSVLQTIGTTALAGAGLGAASSGVAAVETKRRLADAYADEDRLRAAFAEHADGVVATLREEGFVGESFDLGSLDFAIDADAGGVAPTAADGRAGVTTVVVDGTATALGMVSASSDTHDLSLYVQPQREEAYAFVEPAGGGDRLIVTAEGVEPQGCSYTSCEDCCSSDYEREVTWNCIDGCTNCRVYQASCSCYELTCI